MPHENDASSEWVKDDSQPHSLGDTRIQSEPAADRSSANASFTASPSAAGGIENRVGSAGTDPVERIDRYRILRLLGRGGFGAVYLAEDETLRRQVAIKVAKFTDGSSVAEAEFLKEARQLAQLNHPGIVSVFDIGHDSGRCFLVADFLSGQSLAQWLTTHEPEWRTSVEICIQLADAIAHAHSHRTIHRDLKPANVIIVEGTRPVIVDFGLAVSDGQRAEGSLRGEISGTPAFMSPEQAAGLGHRIDGRTDIYSLGAILYRLLTGREPFAADSVVELLRQVIEDEPQPPRQVVRSIPAELERVCLKAMEKTLRDRYTTADDLADDLRAILGSGPPASRGVTIRLPTEQEPVDRLRETIIGPLSPQADIPPRESATKRPAGYDPARISNSDGGPTRALSDDSRSASSLVRRGESQRRQVTIVNCSCDVFDNASLLETLDAEEQAALLSEFQQYCADIALKFEGTVLQTTEDGIAVCFGFPTAFEDAVRRAIRMGLAVRDRMAAFTGNLRTDQEPVAARVAVHTDYAIARVDAENHDETTSVSIMGSVRNVASRLLDFVQPGCVVMSNPSWLLCRNRFDCDSLGSQQVRGLPNAIELHEVVSELRGGSGFDGAAEQDLSPLVGRDREIGLLQERWQQAVEGMGQVVLIIGDAGLGKSRLVHAIKRHVIECSVDGRVVPVAEWLASSQRQHSSLYPAVDYFERHLGFEYGDSPRSRLEKLVAYLAELNLDGEDEIALLAGLLSIPLEGRYAEPDLTPQARKEQLMALLLDWLREVSDRQPLLFIIEDLHWVDPSTLEFLELLVNQGLNDRILTLFTFRPEFETPWGSRAHQTSLALNRLTKQQLQQLVQSRAGRAFPAGVVDRIMQRTDGVPLFVEEFTRVLMEADAPSSEDSSLSPIDALRQIPASLHDMLMARLDRIAGDIEVMQLGAVIGRVFTLSLLKAASGIDNAELQRELQKLADAELLFVQGRGARTRYSFKHALIQDAAYDSMVKAKRQELHRRLACAIESSFPDTCVAEPEVLARHFAEAGDFEKAWFYWNRAGERSLQRYAYREAIEQIRGALLALEGLPDSRDNRFRKIELHISLGVPLQSLEGYSAKSVEENYARAYELCQEVQLPVQFIPVLYGLFRFYMLKARHDKAGELGRQLVELASEAGEDDYSLFAHRAMAGPMFYQAQYESALPHLNTALSIPATEQLRIRGRRYDVVDPWVNAGSYKSWVLWMTGYADQAHQESQRAIATAESLNHPFSLALALSFAAWLHQFEEDVDATLAAALRAQAISNEQGFQFWTGWHEVMIGWARGIDGKQESAIDDIRRGLADWRAQGSELGSAYFTRLLADVATAHGRRDEAHQALDEADRLSNTTGERFSLPEQFGLRGELALLEKDPASAEQHFRRAIEIAQKQSSRYFELRSTVRLSRLLKSCGRAEEAVSMLTSSRAWFTEGLTSRDIMQADRLLVELRGK